MLIINKWKITSVGEDVEKLEPSNIPGGNIKWCSHLEKVWWLLKKLNIGLPYGPEISLLAVYLKELKTRT